MYRRFIDFLQREHLVAEGQRVLLAVSGGRDSVTMAHLFQRAGIPFGIAHCNFHLRPGDCDRDELFVRSMAEGYGVALHCTGFDTQSYAQENGLSIEEAARQLRYDYFERVRQEEGYGVVATAHHRDDAIETFFINLLRGTGVNGLTGISVRNGKIIRPLLPFGRAEIDKYVKRHNLTYVEDITNSQPVYLRNRIRLQLLPMMRQISPAFDDVMSRNMVHIEHCAQLYNQTVDRLREQLLHSDDGVNYTVDIPSLLRCQPIETVLYELLHPFGFNSSVVEQVTESLHAQSGKQFFSSTHRLVKDRDILLVSPLQCISNQSSFIISRPQLNGCGSQFVVDVSRCMVEFHFDNACDGTMDRVRQIGRDEAWYDFDRVRFPLSLRRWQKGDRFTPYGMKGSRLVSDLLTDVKVSLVEKEKVWLLCDADGRIMWVLGIRTADVAVVTTSTRTIMKVRIK